MVNPPRHTCSTETQVSVHINKHHNRGQTWNIEKVIYWHERPRQVLDFKIYIFFLYKKIAYYNK